MIINFGVVSEHMMYKHLWDSSKCSACWASGSDEHNILCSEEYPEGKANM